MKKDLELGKRIAWLRKNRHMEQAEAAKKIGIGYHTYQPYEYGNHPSRKNLELILNFYGCSRSWLLTGEGSPYPDQQPEKQEIPQEGVVYLNPAVRILNEAIAEAGIDLNDAQKTALLKIIQDELHRTSDKVKEIIRVFRKEGSE